MALVIPTNKAKLCLINTLSLQLVDQILNLVECHSHAHLGLVLQGLMLDRCWYRLPALTNTNFGSSCGVGKMLIILHALLQHLRHLVTLDEILAIATCHSAIAVSTLWHWIEIYDKRLVCSAMLQVVDIRKAIFTLLMTIGLNTLKLQALCNSEICTALGLEATHRHTQILCIALILPHSAMLKLIEETILGNEIALLAIVSTRHRRDYLHLSDTLQLLGRELKTNIVCILNSLQMALLGSCRAILIGKLQLHSLLGLLLKSRARHCCKYCNDSKKKFFHCSHISIFHSMVQI